MILYFTGTGNSRFVAKMLANDLNDNLVSINEIFKADTKWEFHSETPFVLVTPIYAWRLPEKIESLLEQGIFTGSNKIYLIVTMGSYAASAGKYCQKILRQKNMDLMGFRGICMPDNYMVSYCMLSNKDAVTQIRKSIPMIHETAKAISRSERFVPDGYKKRDWFLSSAANRGFNHFAANSDSFKVSGACVKCKKCISVCPVNNISLKDNAIHFGNQCMFCLSCIHQCPVHAIDYKGKGEKNGYYTCPSDSEILSDNR